MDNTGFVTQSNMTQNPQPKPSFQRASTRRDTTHTKGRSFTTYLGERTADGHLTPQLGGERTLQWHVGFPGYKPVEVLQRFAIEKREASQRYAIGKRSSYTTPARGDATFSEFPQHHEELVDVTWSSRTTSSPFSRSSTLEMPPVRSTLPPKVRSRTLAQTIAQTTNMGIFLTTAEVSRVWSAHSTSTYNEKICALRLASKQAENHRAFKMAVFVATSETHHTSVRVSKVVAASLMRSTTGRQALSSARGTIRPQGSEPFPTLADIPLGVYDALFAQLNRYGFSYTSEDIPLAELLGLGALFTTADSSVRAILAFQFLLGKTWRTLTATMEKTIVTKMASMFYMLVDMLMDKFPSEEDDSLPDYNALEELDPEEASSRTYTRLGSITPQAAFPWVTRVRHSPLVVRTLTMLVKIFTFGFFGDEGVAGMFANSTAALLLKKVTKSFDEVSAITDLVDYWATRGALFLKTGKMEDLFEEQDELRADREITEITKALENLKNSGPHIREIFVKARVVMARWSRSDSRLITSKVQLLDALIIRMQRNLRVEREMPLGVIISGSSGIGKTLLASQLARWIAVQKGYPRDVSNLQTHADTKHQNLQAIVDVYALQDYFQIRDEDGPIPAMQLLQSLVDTSVMRLETASLEEKSNSAISPDYVLVSTNRTSFHFTTSTGDVGKLGRRYIALQMSWSPLVYATANSTAPMALIQAAKSLNYEGCVLYTAGLMAIPSGPDCKDLKLTPANPFPGQKTLSVFTTASDVLAFLATRLALLRQEGKAGQFACSKCGLPNVAAKCPSPGCGGVVVDFSITPQGYTLQGPLRPYGHFDEEEFATVVDAPEPVLPLEDIPMGGVEDGLRLWTQAISPERRSALLRYIESELWAERRDALGPPFPGHDWVPPERVPVLQLVEADLPMSAEEILFWRHVRLAAYDLEFSAARLDYSRRMALAIRDAPVEQLLPPAPLRTGATEAAVAERLRRRNEVIDSQYRIYSYSILSIAHLYGYQWDQHADFAGAERLVEQVLARWIFQGWLVWCSYSVMVTCWPWFYPTTIVPQGNVQMNHVHDLSPELKQSVLEASRMPATLLAKLTRGISAFVAISTGVVAAIAIYKFVRDLLRPQGALVTKVNIPSTPVLVQPIASKNTPWLAQTAVNYQVDLLAGPTRMFGTYILPHLLATSWHFFKPLVPGSEISITSKGVTYLCKYDPQLMIPIPSTDLAFLFTPHVKNIVGPIAKSLVSAHGTPTLPCSMGGHVDLPVVFERGLYYYPAPTEAGSCGQALYDTAGRVYGLHRGREQFGQQRGVASPLGQPQLAHAVQALSERGFSLTEPDLIVPQNLQLQIDAGRLGMHPNSDMARAEEWSEKRVANTGLIPVCHLPLADKGTMTTRPSKLFPVFGGEIPPYTAPYNGKAKLVEGEWRSPALYRMDDGLKNVGNPNFPILSKVFSELINAIPRSAEVYPPVTLQQAITGDPRNQYMNARDVTKSIGWTLKQKGLTKKTAYTRGEDGVWNVHPIVISEVNRILAEAAGDGPLSLDVVVATLKDEAYPAEKSALCKARFFYVSEHASNLAMRMYLLPILSYLANLPFVTGINISMNPGSDQWKTMHDYLLRFGPRVFDGDFKAFDISHYELVFYYFKVIVSTGSKLGYSPKDLHILSRLLSRSLWIFLIIAGNVFLAGVQWLSGRVDTIVGNCIMGRAIMLYAAESHRVARNTYLAPPLLSLMLSLHTGDDTAANWDPALQLGAPDVQRYAKDLGYTMTSADKSAEMTLRPISEIQYLKRGFREVGSRVYAPLAKESIFKSLAYVTGIGLEAEDLRNRATAQCAVREAFMHGEDFFDSLRARLLLCFPDEHYPTYAELDTAYSLGFYTPWDALSLTLGEELPGDQGIILEQHRRLITPPLSAWGEKLSSMYTEAPLWNAQYSQTDGVMITPQSFISITDLNSNSITTNNILPNPVVSIGTVAVDTLSLPGSLKDLRRHDPDVSVMEMFAKPLRHSTLNVAVGTTQPIYLTWCALPQIYDTLKRVAMFRGDAEVTLALTGSNHVMGLTRVCFYPNSQKSGPYEMTIKLPVPDPLYCSQNSCFPHVDLDLSMTATHVIKLPFPFPRHYNHAFAGVNDWTLVLIPINPIKSVTGITPPTLLVDVYVSYHNVELNSIIAQGATEASSGQIANMLGYAQRVAEVLPFPWSSPVSKLLGAGAGVAKYFGWSRPLIAPQEAMIRRTGTCPSYASGQPEFADGFNLDPSVNRYVGGDHIPLHSHSDTSFRSLVERSAMIISDWQIGDTMRMVPGIAAANGTSSVIAPTPLGFASSMFQYWTGDLTLCVQVVGSPLIRWKIMVLIVPPGAALPTSIPATGSQYRSTIIEVVGTTCTDITIPYLYFEPFQKFFFTNNQHSTLFASETRVLWFPMGDPQGGSVTPSLPYVNAWIKAGENFSVGVPSLEYVNKMILEQGAPSGLGAQSVAVFGEVVDDLLLLTRRSVHSHDFTATAANSRLAFPSQPTAPEDANFVAMDAPFQAWSFVTYLGSAYMGCSGSYVYRLVTSGMGLIVINEAEGLLGSAARTTVGKYYADSTSRGATFQATLDSPFREIRVPDRNPGMFRYPTHVGTTWATSTSTVVCTMYTPTSTPAIQVWTSGGDDFMLGGFLAPPILKVRV